MECKVNFLLQNDWAGVCPQCWSVKLVCGVTLVILFVVLVASLTSLVTEVVAGDFTPDSKDTVRVVAVLSRVWKSPASGTVLVVRTCVVSC